MFDWKKSFIKFIPQKNVKGIKNNPDIKNTPNVKSTPKISIMNSPRIYILIVKIVQQSMVHKVIG